MNEDEARNFLWDLVDDISNCMMVTQDGDRFRGRPMKGVAAPDENAIWFVAERASPKHEEIVDDSVVCLTFADPQAGKFASLSGRAEVISNREKILAYWNERVSTYFPNREPEESTILIRVTPEFGEFWDTPNKALIIAIKFIEAKITGQRPELGMNEKVSLEVS